MQPELRPASGIYGSRVDGVAERARLSVLGRRALPPFPDGRLIPPVVIPPPPKLESGLSDLERVKMLAAGYRGSMLAVYRRRSAFMLHLATGPPGHLSLASKSRAILDAAMLLFEAKIAPAGWCLFSLSSWKSMEHTKRPPTVNWVFSGQRIESQREWYESERTRWARRIERPVREHVVLIDSWKRMWRDLLRKRPPDRTRLLAIVDEHFPDDSFERAVEFAKRESARAQLRIDRRIADGEIPWTA